MCIGPEGVGKCPSKEIVVPASALARIPDELRAAEAGTTMGRAGVTMFNALRRSAARPGDLVARPPA